MFCKIFHFIGGFASGSFAACGGYSFVVAFVLGVIGACSGSSAAGLSVFRVQLSAAHTREQLDKAIDAFIEVDEITLDRKIRRIFSGWMFADSPALNAIEHPIYDVWLTGCKVESEVPPPPGVEAVAKPAPEPARPADTGTPAPTAARACAGPIRSTSSAGSRCAPAT